MNEGMKAQMKSTPKDLDYELKHALQRQEPPDGFAERVLSRVGEPQADPRDHNVLPWDPASAGLILKAAPGLASERSRPGPARHFVQWAAAAALVAAVAGGIEYRTVQKERAEGEAAKARVMLGLHIAGSKLQLVQTKINGMHEQSEKNLNQ